MENLGKFSDFKWISCNFCGWDDCAIWEDELLVRWLARTLHGSFMVPMPDVVALSATVVGIRPCAIPSLSYLLLTSIIYCRFG